jgi:hypothetical protein
MNTFLKMNKIEEFIDYHHLGFLTFYGFVTFTYHVFKFTSHVITDTFFKQPDLDQDDPESDHDYEHESNSGSESDPESDSEPEPDSEIKDPSYSIKPNKKYRLRKRKRINSI